MAASTHPPVDISGTCAAGYGGVKDAFATNFEKNGDVGACVAVAVDGELVVDIWGGHQDAERTTPWERDTIVNVWSTTKTMTNLCALVLASRGRLELDAPVATYWPELAAAGKQAVLMRHLLAHTAGLPAWDTRLATSGSVRLGPGHPAAGRAGALVAAWNALRLSWADPGQSRRRGDPPRRRPLGRAVLR